MQIKGLVIDQAKAERVEESDDPTEIVLLKRAIDRLEKGQVKAAASAMVDAVNLVGQKYSINASAIL